MNGWQRIGIVLSIIWILGAGFYQRSSDIQRAGDMGGWAMTTCQETQKLKGSLDFSRCNEEFEKMFRVFADPSWGNVAFVAFAPIPVAWLLAYIIVWVSRWVRRGFAAQ